MVIPQIMKKKSKSLHPTVQCTCLYEAGSLNMNTALEYSTRVVQEGGRRCKKSTLNDLVHLTPLRIPLMNPSMLLLRSTDNTVAVVPPSGKIQEPAVFTFLLMGIITIYTFSLLLSVLQMFCTDHVQFLYFFFSF